MGKTPNKGEQALNFSGSGKHPKKKRERKKKEMGMVQCLTLKSRHNYMYLVEGQHQKIKMIKTLSLPESVIETQVILTSQSLDEIL